MKYIERIYSRSMRIFLSILIFSAYTYVSASAAELHLTPQEQQYLDAKKSIKVANLPNFEPFSFILNQQPAGYSIEYMRMVGEYLGKDIEFVSDTWNAMLDMLKNGTLDVIPHIAVTEERKAFVDYTDFIHVHFTTGFALRKGEYISSMEDLKGKQVAVAKNTFLHTYLKNTFPDIPLLLLKSTKDAINAVTTDDAYAVIGSLPTLNYYIQEDWISSMKSINIRDLGLPTMTSLPMGVTKGNSLLKSILEKVDKAIPKEKVNELKQKWIFTPEAANRNTLTTTEMLFLKQHPVIRFRVRPDRPPFDFMLDGTPQGIAVDYIKKIADIVGFKAELVISDISVAESYDAVQNDRTLFDTLLFTVNSPARADRFAFGDPYLSYPMMIITHKDYPLIGKTSDLNGKKVVLEKGFLTNKWIKRDYPKIKIVPANSTAEALRMLNRKEADAYIGNIAVANYMINHEGLDNIRIAAPSDYGNVKFSFVAPKEWPELASILSKGYRSIDQDFHSALQQKWFTVQMIDTTNYSLFTKIAVAAAFLLTWVMWWNRKLRVAKKQTDCVLSELREAQKLMEKQNEQLEILSVTDKLTGLYNRMKLDNELKSELKRAERYGESFGVIILDIDHFKNVNDKYGHLAGDKILISMAEILKENIREVDTAGRWGGEEFLILTPQANREGLITMAENMKKLIATHPFCCVDKMTVSFGTALWQKGDNPESIVSRADAGLYESKQNGRNRVTFK
jgi:polar amino acid transport system substrate-binding protein